MSELLSSVAALTAKAKLLSAKEIKDRVHLTEGVWETRMTDYLNDPVNAIPNVGIVRDLTRAILTQRHARHLADATIVKHTKLLERWTA